MGAAIAAPALLPARGYIGGGHIAAILGVSPHQTPLQAYHEIVGEAPEISEEKRRFFNRRKKVEPFVISILEEERGLKIVRRNQRYTDPQLPFLRAEIDAETHDDKNIEIKSVGEWADDPWGAEEDGDAGVPMYVLAQVMHGFGVTQRKEGIVVGQLGFDGDRLYTVYCDGDLVRLVRARAEEFWHEHVEKRIPPAPISPADAVRRWPSSKWRKVVAPAGIIEVARHMREIDVQIDQLIAKREAAKLELQKFMTDADRLVDERGKTVCDWRSGQPGTVTDHESYARDLEERLRPLLMLPEEIDELREKHTRPRQAARPFYNRIRKESVQ